MTVERPFAFSAVPPTIAEYLNAALATGDLGVVKAATQDARLLLLMQQFVASLKKRALQLQDDPEYTPEMFDEDTHKLLEAALYAALILGLGTAARAMRDQARATAASRATEVLQYLQNFADEIEAHNLSDAQIEARADLYAGNIWGAAARGKVIALPPETRWQWRSRQDGKVCDDCADLDGQEFTLATLPCFPGESDFGGVTQCGSNCRCRLIEKITIPLAVGT